MKMKRKKKKKKETGRQVHKPFTVNSAKASKVNDGRKEKALEHIHHSVKYDAVIFFSCGSQASPPLPPPPHQQHSRQVDSIELNKVRIKESFE